MNRRPLFILVLCTLVAGCGSHYYRIDGNDMVMILRKPEARSVMLACSLDDFHPRQATNVSGCWEVTLPADEAFTYFYRVDGVAFVPDCPMKENDDFGSESCIFDPQL